MQDITNKCVMHYIKGGTTDKMRPHRTHLLHATHHISFPLGMLLRAELSSSTFYGKKWCQNNHLMAERSIWCERVILVVDAREYCCWAGKPSPGLPKTHHAVSVGLTPVSLVSVMSRLVSGLVLTPAQEHAFAWQDRLSRPPGRARAWTEHRHRQGDVQHPESSSAPSWKVPLQGQNPGHPQAFSIECSGKQGQRAWMGCLSGPIPRTHLIKLTSFVGPSLLLPKFTALIKFKLLILKERKDKITSQVRVIELLEVVCPLLCFFPPNERGSQPKVFRKFSLLTPNPV